MLLPKLNKAKKSTSNPSIMPRKRYYRQLPAEACESRPSTLGAEPLLRMQNLFRKRTSAFTCATQGLEPIAMIFRLKVVDPCRAIRDKFVSLGMATERAVNG